MPRDAAQPPAAALRREVGLFGAVMMGLGSIIGTGVFVSIGLAAGVAGPAVVTAIAAAAVVAACNGLSSAQLAANHPVSGGTYEYGYRYLTPSLGFTAGWMFLCAKCASAATAALGFAGYALHAVGWNDPAWRIPLALGAVAVMAALVLCGIRRSSRANVAIVSVTLLALILFIAAGAAAALRSGRLAPSSLAALVPGQGGSGAWADWLEACALLFVAYTGYGRIATLGEEIHDPRRNIPRAIVITLLVSMALYAGVGLVGVATVGADVFGRVGTERAAPLEIAARRFAGPAVALVVAVGAMTAMFGVLLNLILGLSRVVLAMSRRSDLPSPLSRLNRGGSTPVAAVLLVAAVVAGLVLIGSVQTTWSFSAFTVLIYYALTNLAALRLRAAERLYPRSIAGLGLAGCLFLAFWVERTVWMVGLGLIVAGLGWHGMRRGRARSGSVVRDSHDH